MKSLVFLVLLLFLFERSVQDVDQKPKRQDEVQENESGKSQVSYNYCDTCSELKELRDMVIEQRVWMQILKDKLSEQAAALKSIQDELISTKNELQLQKSEQETLKNELQRVTSELETVRRENSARSSQLTDFESRMVLVEKTLQEDAEQLKVAFSVGLTNSGSFGPFSHEEVLVYERVFYNHGQGYNPVNGIFMAPKKGAYYFRFTGHDYGSNRWTGLLLYLNANPVVSNGGSHNGEHIHYSNGIVLELNEGDSVYMRIPRNMYLYDGNKSHCTFTGFLLFTL